MSYWCECPVCWHSTETWILSRLSVLEAPPSCALTQPSTMSQTQIQVNKLFIPSQPFQIFFKYCSTYMNGYIKCSDSCCVNLKINFFYSYPITFISTFWQVKMSSFPKNYVFLRSLHYDYEGNECTKFNFTWNAHITCTNLFWQLLSFAFQIW